MKCKPYTGNRIGVRVDIRVIDTISIMEIGEVSIECNGEQVTPCLILGTRPLSVAQRCNIRVDVKVGIYSQ